MFRRFNLKGYAYAVMFKFLGLTGGGRLVHFCFLFFKVSYYFVNYSPNKKAIPKVIGVKITFTKESA